VAQHNELGRTAEQMAVEYLERKGYKILARNWRYGKAEIDIIALDGDTLAVVEVKARTSDYFGDPAHFVNPKKIKRLVEAADAYVRQNELDYEVRFDIISILKNRKQQKIEHIENAFYWY